MIRIGDKIKLADNEKRFIRMFADDIADPQTVEDYNAWLRKIQSEADASVPEMRLLAAIAQGMEVKR